MLWYTSSAAINTGMNECEGLHCLFKIIPKVSIIENFPSYDHVWLQQYYIELTHGGIAAERANALLHCSLEEDVSDVASDTVAHGGGENKRDEG